MITQMISGENKYRKQELSELDLKSFQTLGKYV